MTALSIGSFKSFWKAALLIGGLAAWSLPVWNIVVNPYQVFNTRFFIGERYESSTTNERFLKVEYLLKKAKSTLPDSSQVIVERINDEPRRENVSGKKQDIMPDAFLVGSSIMRLVDPGLVNRYYPNQHFYNLAFLAAKPDEILATLRGLKKGGVTIKTVVYGLEPIAFTDIKSYGPAYQLHPDAGNQNRHRVLFDMLFASAARQESSSPQKR